MIRKLSILILTLAIFCGTFLMFKALREVATIERGCEAIGGEHLVLLLPVIIYLFIRNAEDTMETREKIFNENTCVCCGETIPEGRQVCPKCEKGVIQNDR